MTKWPAKVSCYGRRYEARNEAEFEVLCAFLVGGDMRAANQFRVGGSWPRGERARSVPSGKFWHCRDCGLRHRDTTAHCTFSHQQRSEVELR